MRPTRDAPPLRRIILPVPTPRTKGVLVFPAVDGSVIAGPTAVDQEDKRDRHVSPEAVERLNVNAPSTSASTETQTR